MDAKKLKAIIMMGESTASIRRVYRQRLDTSRLLPDRTNKATDF